VDEPCIVERGKGTGEVGRQRLDQSGCEWSRHVDDLLK
jgi:hypothetical protein